MNDQNRPQGRHAHPKKDHHKPQRVVEVLPPPELLESYNYVVDGSAKLILQMFEREQQHRHAWETRALKTHTLTSVLGQLMGFIIALAIFITAGIIGTTGDKTIGAAIWVFGTAIIVMAGTIWLYAKSMGQRPLFARPAMRTHFRPDQKVEEGQPVDMLGRRVERRHGQPPPSQD